MGKTVHCTLLGNNKKQLGLALKAACTNIKLSYYVPVSVVSGSMQALFESVSDALAATYNYKPLKWRTSGCLVATQYRWEQASGRRPSPVEV